MSGKRISAILRSGPKTYAEWLKTRAWHDHRRSLRTFVISPRPLRVVVAANELL